MSAEIVRLRRVAEDAAVTPDAAVDALRRYVDESSSDGGGDIILPLSMARRLLEAMP